MLPDRIPAASAISRTVVARKPFCANSSLAIRSISARRRDRPAPFAALGAAARPPGWLVRDGSIAPLWLVDRQPPKRLLGFARLGSACRSASALHRGRVAGRQRGACLVSERGRDQQ